MTEEKEAWKPRPFKRQKRLRGKDKLKRRRYYLKNKNKLRLKSKRLRDKLKRNPAWKRFQKKRRKERARRRRVAKEINLLCAKIAKLSFLLRADLDPPLGWRGGPCGLVERVQEEVPPNRQKPIIELVQRGQAIPERQVYNPHKTKGPWKFQMELTPHAQYRMDLRSVTEPEIRAVIGEFFKEMNSQRSKGDDSMWKKFTSFERIEYISPRLHNLLVVFQLDNNGKEVDVITTYRKNEPDPRGSCSSLG